MRIAILHEAVPQTARPDETDVLVQVRAVESALEEIGHAHWAIAVPSDLSRVAEALAETAPDAVFNLVESLEGTGRHADKVPSLLESLGIPFTGSGSDATRRTTSKLLARATLVPRDIPVPLAYLPDDLIPGAAVVPGRYLVKSVWEHGSLGLHADSVVSVADAAGLHAEILARRDRLGGEAFAEAFLDGREFNLAMLTRGNGLEPHDAGDDVEHLPAAEIRFDPAMPGPRIVGYEAKWAPGSPQDLSTPRAFELPPGDAALVESLRALARRTWDAFGLRGYARVDFRLDETGRPFVIDVNTNPCLSPDAGFRAALDEAGIPFARAIARILADALRPR